ITSPEGVVKVRAGGPPGLAPIWVGPRGGSAPRAGGVLPNVRPGCVAGVDWGLPRYTGTLLGCAWESGCTGWGLLGGAASRRCGRAFCSTGGAVCCTGGALCCTGGALCCRGGAGCCWAGAGLSVFLLLSCAFFSGGLLSCECSSIAEAANVKPNTAHLAIFRGIFMKSAPWTVCYGNNRKPSGPL